MDDRERWRGRVKEIGVSVLHDDEEEEEGEEDYIYIYVKSRTQSLYIITIYIYIYIYIYICCHAQRNFSVTRHARGFKLGSKPG